MQRTPYQERILVELRNKHYPVGAEVLVVAHGRSHGAVTQSHAYLLDQRVARIRLDVGDVELGRVRPARTQFAAVSPVSLELSERSPEEV
jgi:hypothetical protein